MALCRQVKCRPFCQIGALLLVPCAGHRSGRTVGICLPVHSPPPPPPPARACLPSPLREWLPQRSLRLPIRLASSTAGCPLPPPRASESGRVRAGSESRCSEPRRPLPPPPPSPGFPGPARPGGDPCGPAGRGTRASWRRRRTSAASAPASSGAPSAPPTSAARATTIRFAAPRPPGPLTPRPPLFHLVSGRSVLAPPLVR